MELGAAPKRAKRPPSDGAVPAPSRWKAKDGAWVTLMGGTYACYVRVMAISGRYAMVRRPGCGPFVVTVTELQEDCPTTEDDD